VLAVAAVSGGGRQRLGILETELGYRFLPARWSSRDLIAYMTPSEARPGSGHGSSAGEPLTPGTYAVHIVRPDGTVVRTLERALVPSWSPDGSRLAYVHQGARDVLRIAAADGSGARDVINWCCFGVSGPVGAHWSPDGRLLAFAIADQIYVVRPDGTGRRQVTRSKAGGWIDALWWAPDSSRLFYAWEFTNID
jgi:Tol biopolymer transport system component